MVLVAMRRTSSARDERRNSRLDGEKGFLYLLAAVPQCARRSRSGGFRINIARVLRIASDNHDVTVRTREHRELPLLSGSIWTVHPVALLLRERERSTGYAAVVRIDSTSAAYPVGAPTSMTS
jgi:hypothetical protein